MFEYLARARPQVRLPGGGARRADAGRLHHAGAPHPARTRRARRARPAPRGAAGARPHVLLGGLRRARTWERSR